MATQVRIRRGTSEEHKSFTGALGEITVDTTKSVLKVHNGVTPGGVSAYDTTTINIADYGTEVDFLTDTQPILQTLINTYGSNTVIEFDPKYTYNFATKQNWLPPQLVAASFCVALDGLQNVSILGNNSNVTFSGDAAQDGHILFTSYTSDISKALGNYAANITISGFIVHGNRPAGVTKWQTFASVSSTDGFTIEDVHLKGDWNNGPSSIIQGDNTKKFYMRRCSGFGLSTPFDTANFEDCDVDDVVFDSLGSGNGVTGFNLFYAPFVYNTGNLETPMRLGYGSGLTIGKRAVFRGFVNGARIEAQANSEILGTFDSNSSNGVYVSTSSDAEALGFFTDGVYIEGAILSNNGANGARVDDDAAIKNVRVTGNKIYDNGRGISAGNQIVNYYEGDNDFGSRGGVITQTQNVGLPTIVQTVGKVGASNPKITVESNQTDTNLLIAAKGAGVLQLGVDNGLKVNVETHEILGGETVTKYVEMFDKNNVLRKFAIVD